ncbi:rhodanese-related sulfurtransferase [Candidatus Woesearchaeota archaeon]|nr:rhodanese-related sulfurtransferase [Candidatus Woesearchaeota archaeon]
MKNILFYKYIVIDNPEELQKEQREHCRLWDLKGTILIATEGINGCLTGTEGNIQKYQEWLHDDQRFCDLEFKQGLTSTHNFDKLLVKVRKEIVTSGLASDILQQRGEYIEPEVFNRLLDSGEEVYVVDARNNYESNVGHFYNAITPNINNFREWPTAVKQLEHLKEKPIVLYCTGGIRCEKASAYMKQQGFTNVRHLRGGIINYGHEIGNKHWDGKCFVFDKRMTIALGTSQQTKIITSCSSCSLPADTYYHCAYTRCDKRFIACDDCMQKLKSCCSPACFQSILQYPELKAQ